MKVRFVIYGGIALIVCAILVAFWVDDARDQACRITRWHLWGSDIGEALQMEASLVREGAADADNGTTLSPFLPWTHWPADSQARIKYCGAEPLEAREVDGLIVTAFVAPDCLDERWYYVVPAEQSPAEPWAAVIAMNSRYCFVQILPDDTEPVMTRQTETRINPLKVIKRKLAAHIKIRD